MFFDIGLLNGHRTRTELEFHTTAFQIILLFLSCMAEWDLKSIIRYKCALSVDFESKFLFFNQNLPQKFRPLRGELIIFQLGLFKFGLIQEDTL